MCLSRLTFKKSNVTPVQLNAHWQQQDPFLHCFDAHSNSSFCCSFFAHPSTSFILYPNTFCSVTSLLPSLLCNNIFKQGWCHLKARVVLGPPWPNFFYKKIYNNLNFFICLPFKKNLKTLSVFIFIFYANKIKFCSIICSTFSR